MTDQPVRTKTRTIRITGRDGKFYRIPGLRGSADEIVHAMCDSDLGFPIALRKVDGTITLVNLNNALLIDIEEETQDESAV